VWIARAENWRDAERALKLQRVTPSEIGAGLVGERRMSAEEFHQHAARCSQLAEKAPSAKLKGVLLAEAQAWTELAEEQEWLERRKAERRTLAKFPTIRALLSLHSSGAPGKREPR
jgi:hypothetical protein